MAEKPIVIEGEVWVVIEGDRWQYTTVVADRDEAGERVDGLVEVLEPLDGKRVRVTIEVLD